jgi:hypothetical protein
MSPSRSVWMDECPVHGCCQMWSRQSSVLIHLLSMAISLHAIMWCVMCDVWCVMCDVWCVMCDVWCVMCDVCDVMWCAILIDTSSVTRTWHDKSDANVRNEMSIDNRWWTGVECGWKCTLACPLSPLPHSHSHSTFPFHIPISYFTFFNFYDSGAFDRYFSIFIYFSRSTPRWHCGCILCFSSLSPMILYMTICLHHDPSLWSSIEYQWSSIEYRGSISDMPLPARMVYHVHLHLLSHMT